MSDRPSQYRVQPETFSGVVERLTFHSEASGYTVARIKAPRASESITVVGNFANIQAGQTLQLEGTWREHPQYGLQFQVQDYRETKPATLTGIEKYLGSGLIKGVGPATAKRIVAHFGLETLDVIENQLDRLQEIPGIGKKRVAQIRAAWQEQKTIKDVMVFLQSHGVSTTYAVKIYKHYGKSAIATVTENPYQLATDIYGIGFLTADRIARNVGVSPWSKSRYQAGVFHVLRQASEDGHCFLPQPELVQGAVELLGNDDHAAEPETLCAVLPDMARQEKLILESAEGGMMLCYQPSFYHSEKNLARSLLALLSRPVEVDLPRVRDWLGRYCRAQNVQLSEQQQQAVEMAARSRVAILTGGPGTGKTFVTRTIVALWKAMGKAIALAAPTGRAAQRLGEVTGVAAKTLHRLLEFEPATMGFKRGRELPLECEAIVVDEVSMLDLFLAYSLLKAVPEDAQLLLVGDVDQLPSVGPGQVLRDFIAADRIPVVRLTRVFRQAAASAIVRVAHEINQGIIPQIEPVSDAPQGNCLWLEGGSDAAQGLQAIARLTTELLPKWGIKPASDVQVLCPMTRGTVGTQMLNRTLQQLLNPPHAEKAEVNAGATTFRVGDRSIQLKNDYEREVFNGDLGVIEAIDRAEKQMLVQFEGRSVTYDFADLNEVALAWSITIHKSQGSEYPVVILPLYMQHYPMLSRNLLYTGLTRAKRLAILVGESKALAIAVRQTKPQHRYSRLPERLLSGEGDLEKEIGLHAAS